MPVLTDVQEEVESIAEERDLANDRAFSFWYLTEFREMSYELADPYVVDGPWDGGRDVEFEIDEELVIAQMKYSENSEYAKSGFTELANYVKDNREDIARWLVNGGNLTLVLATTAELSDDARNELISRKRGISSILTKSAKQVGADDGFSASKNITIEIHDLVWISQQWQKLLGVDVSLTFIDQPLQFEDGMLGLVDARGLVPHLENDRLLDMNIRKGLGTRNSVNSRILASLKNDTIHSEDGSIFWQLNNGIVCICREFSENGDESKVWDFENFTVVNGAQTSSTIGAFLSDHVESDEWEIPLVAKIIAVGEDFDRAAQLTVTSNSQTSINNQDLRAIGPEHRILEKWFNRIDIQYIYRRGTKSIRGKKKVKMKDLAQAVYALWFESPHISFSRMGKIFSDHGIYTQVFNVETIEEWDRTGTDETVETAAKRLEMVHDHIVNIRKIITEMVKEGALDKKWKSSTFHISWWIYHHFNRSILRNSMDLDANLASLREIENDDVKDIVSTFTVMAEEKDWEIPRDFKNETVLQWMKDVSESATISRKISSALGIDQDGILTPNT